MNELQIFNSPEFGQVRAIEIDGEPWLVGKDVAEALGYGDTDQAIRKHVDVEDKLSRHFDGTGQRRIMTVINESGVYSLIFGSKLSTAKRFKRWVTSEILPAIRKHGAYMTEETIEQVLSDPDTIIALAQQLKAERGKRKELQAQLDRAKEWYSIKRVAQLNGIPWRDISWRKLKEASKAVGMGIKKIFDANYGEVNTYHMKAWEAAYPDLEL